MAKQQSRGARWTAAVADALEIANEIEDAKSRLADALSAIVDVQGEYQDWRDNLPENLQQSALGEKLEAVSDLDTADLLKGIVKTLGGAAPRHPYLLRVDDSEGLSMQQVDEASARLAELEPED